METDELTNGMYGQLTSTVVLNRKQELFFVPLDFKNFLKKDALVDSRAYVNAITQNESDRIKQQAPSNVLKIVNPKILKYK